MVVETDQKRKTVYFWLRSDEEAEEVHDALLSLCHRLKENRYASVLFVSGTEDLCKATAALLKANLNPPMRPSL